ncbi:conserved hypothetical protein [Actinacidiphila cocklensis]|uniref:Uncharacterized protein n=1 Tax=Actinacidiphila cocklensis TaxID=887465 RepID=A0A9W4E5V4_9ACTN|nr:conserved hypothetical protein [Actinacidiphila cocklensis]
MLAHEQLLLDRRDRLKASVTIRSVPLHAAVSGRTAPRIKTRADGAGFPVLCMANRVRTTKRHMMRTFFT